MLKSLVARNPRSRQTIVLQVMMRLTYAKQVSRIVKCLIGMDIQKNVLGEEQLQKHLV